MTPQPSPSVWPSPPKTLAENVRQCIVAAVIDSADHLAQTIQQHVSTPSGHTTEAFLESINPLLEKNLAKLEQYALRNVFSLPSALDPTALVHAVKAKQQADADVTVLDKEIAIRRARIRTCDNLMARLTAAQDTARGQLTAMRNLAPESVPPQQFHILCADIKAAEHDFYHVANILKEHRTNDSTNNPLLQAASSAVSKPTGVNATMENGDENMFAMHPFEEHEPLNHMPSAQGILGISMGADTDRLQDLAILRARLLG